MQADAYIAVCLTGLLEEKCGEKNTFFLFVDSKNQIKSNLTQISVSSSFNRINLRHTETRERRDSYLKIFHWMFALSSDCRATSKQNSDNFNGNKVSECWLVLTHVIYVYSHFAPIHWIGDSANYPWKNVNKYYF